MKKIYYIVICLSVGGIGKKIYRSGDKVSSANFPPGTSEQLREQGFLKIDEEKMAEVAAAEGVLSPGLSAEDENKLQEAEILLRKESAEDHKEAGAEEDESKEDGGAESLIGNLQDAAGTSDSNKTPTFDEMTKNQLKEYLTKKQISFDPSANKEKLYKLFIDNQ